MSDEVEDRVLYEKIGTCGRKVKRLSFTFIFVLYSYINVKVVLVVFLILDPGVPANK